MLKAFPFGEWLPDLAPNGTHLDIATNVVPIANGYAPVGDFSAITSALPADFTGGAAFVGSDGTASLLSATSADLYRYSGSWSSVLTVATSNRWRFAQFGDNVICANGGVLVAYDLLGGTAAAISGAPTATDVAAVKDFVVILEPDGDQLKVRWSAFNDSSSWTIGTNQADESPLLSGGKGVAVVGGEYGIILQRNAIRRMTYVGPPFVFQIDEISAEVGCMAQGSVCNVGRLIFFLSERGFMMCDGSTVTPIGDEKFNRWFFDNYSRDDIESMWSAVDPRRSLVLWGMPGSPGKMLAFNWVLGRASIIETDLAGIFTGFTSNTSLDSLGDIDAISGSLDDPIYAGGNPLFLVVNSANEVGALTGSNLAAQWRIRNLEPSKSRRSRIRALKPVTDATMVTASVDAKMRPGDAENVVTAGSLRDSGRMPLRANGRYCSVTVGVPSGEDWTFAQGVELEFEAGDGR